MSRPNIFRLNTWSRHEKNILALLFKALDSLKIDKLADMSENKISRKLYLELRHNVALEGLSYNVVLEAANQPVLNEKPNIERERKRPDIQILWTNPHEEDINKYQREYIIECKRLGNPLRKDRILTTEYVTKGIFRFISKEYGYAKGVSSSAMIGYVQNMELDDILHEVNVAAGIYSISPIDSPAKGWQTGGITHLEQKLIRTEVDPANFGLRHLWADFRTL